MTTSSRSNADQIVSLIERGRRNLLDEAATELYVESRIALVEYPEIRLRTENMWARRSVVVHVWGWHHASHWRVWSIDGGLEFWLEDILDDAEQCAAVVRWRLEREFYDLMRRDTRLDDLKAEIARDP